MPSHHNGSYKYEKPPDAETHKTTWQQPNNDFNNKAKRKKERKKWSNKSSELERTNGLTCSYNLFFWKLDGFVDSICSLFFPNKDSIYSLQLKVRKLTCTDARFAGFLQPDLLYNKAWTNEGARW